MLDVLFNVVLLVCCVAVRMDGSAVRSGARVARDPSQRMREQPWQIYYTIFLVLYLKFTLNILLRV